MNDATCKGCGRKIVWAKSPAGKLTPYAPVKVFAIVNGQAIEGCVGYNSTEKFCWMSTVEQGYISHSE